MDLLDEVGYWNTTFLRWVKAHVGYYGNEKADSLAKMGADDPDLRMEKPPALSPSVASYLVKRGFDWLWNERSRKSTDCRQTKQWFPATKRELSGGLLRLGRNSLSVVLQLIRGHNFLRRHNALVKSDEEAECRLCGEDEETSFHIVAECPALARTRLSVLGYFKLSEPLDWSVSKVLCFLRETSVEELMDPLRED